MLYAFEQLIINTEDLEEYGDEEEPSRIEVEAKRAEIMREIENESDPYMKQ